MYEHSMLPIQQCLKGSLELVRMFLCLCLASIDHTSPAVKNMLSFNTFNAEIYYVSDCVSPQASKVCGDRVANFPQKKFILSSTKVLFYSSSRLYTVLLHRGKFSKTDNWKMLTSIDTLKKN